MEVKPKTLKAIAAQWDPETGKSIAQLAKFFGVSSEAIEVLLHKEMVSAHTRLGRKGRAGRPNLYTTTQEKNHAKYLRRKERRIAQQEKTA